MDREASPVQSVDRALRLLEVLARSGGRLPVSELAARAELPLGTCHRLLQSLMSRGYIRQDPDRRYALGAALLPLGDAASRLLASWAQPFLAELAEVSGETANLAVLEDDRVVYLGQAPGRHRMRMFTEVGRRVLPHSTAVGKVLLAWQDEVQVNRIVARFGLPAHTPQTLTDGAVFAAELAEVRRAGHAVDDEEEEEGVRCIAVPVGPGPTAVAAVSISAPASRLQRDCPELVLTMQSIAGRMSRSLAAPSS
ncbi:MAG: IclR-family transcriptional regulator [Frankiales bacterium]|nr:IclR-family transcriptional regulator [Frankiales bacterium]